MCSHVPQCPDVDSDSRDLAVVTSSHPEQGWRLLCNGVVLFDDTGVLLPNGTAIAPHRPTDLAPLDAPRRPRPSSRRPRRRALAAPAGRSGR